MDLVSEIKASGLELDKEKSQFLTADPGLAKAIAREVSEGSVVFEAGAGLGFLTKELSKKSKKVIAVEVDRRFKPWLERLPTNVKIIIGNALEEIQYQAFDTLVSNTPYLITEALLSRLMPLWKPAVLSVPIQQAEALQAKPGSAEYTKLSFYVQGSYRITRILEFPKEATYPPSTVPGVVLKLEPLKARPLDTVDQSGHGASEVYAGDKAGFLARFLCLHETMKLKNSLREGLIAWSAVARPLETIGPSGHRAPARSALTKNQAKELMRFLGKNHANNLDATAKEMVISTLHHIVVQLSQGK